MISKSELKEKAKHFIRSGASTFLHHSGLLKALSKRQDCRVLMYHRVIDPESLPFPIQAGMFVRPETFRRQMNFLRENADVLSLTEVISRILRGDEIPKRSVVLTFDDGWLDNFTNAFPILQEFNLPATVFLPTAFIGTGEIFWTDAVALLDRPEHRARFVASFSERTLLDRLPRATCVRGQLLFQEMKRNFHLEGALKFFFRLGFAERHAVLEVLYALVDKDMTSLPRQFLNWDEVRQLVKQIEFGSHSHRHLLYAEQPVETVQADYRTSKQVFEKENVPLHPCFCYPGGALSAATQNALFQEQVSFALSTVRKWETTAQPSLIGRIGIHEDVSHSVSRFGCRIWGGSRW